MRILYEDMKETMQNILVKNGFDEKRAEESAKNFADSSLDGVYSHGYQRFPRVIEYIRKGYIDVNALPEKITGYGAAERWDGHLGMGNLNAKLAMDRAIELAGKHGIGMVAMSNTNHWMRGGTYGWQAAEAGCIGICWTNTCPNMPAWGAAELEIILLYWLFQIKMEIMWWLILPWHSTLMVNYLYADKMVSSFLIQEVMMRKEI